MKIREQKPELQRHVHQRPKDAIDASEQAQIQHLVLEPQRVPELEPRRAVDAVVGEARAFLHVCLLYTSPSPRD